MAEEEEMKAIDKEVRQMVDAATEKAKTDGIIDVAALYADIYSSDTPPQHIRGATIDHCVTQKTLNSQQLVH